MISRVRSRSSGSRSSSAEVSERGVGDRSGGCAPSARHRLGLGARGLLPQPLRPLLFGSARSVTSSSCTISSLRAGVAGRAIRAALITTCRSRPSGCTQAALGAVARPRRRQASSLQRAAVLGRARRRARPPPRRRPASSPADRADQRRPARGSPAAAARRRRRAPSRSGLRRTRPGSAPRWPPAPLSSGTAHEHRHLRAQHRGVVRLEQIVHRALRVAAENVLGVLADRRHEDDRHVAGALSLLDQRRRLQPSSPGMCTSSRITA